MAISRLRLRRIPIWLHGIWPGLWLIVAGLAGALVGGLPLSQLVWAGAAVAGVGLLLLILAEPMLGLAAIILLAPLTPYTRINIDPRLDPGQILMAVWAVAVLLKLLARGEREMDRGIGERRVLIPFRLPLSPFLILFLLATALSFFPAVSFLDWASEWLKWIEILVLYVAVASLNTGEHDARKRLILIGALIASAAFQGVVGWVEYTRGYGPPEFNIPGTRFFRAYGTFEQPNPFGGYMGLLWPVVAGVALALLHPLIPRLRLTIGHFKRPRLSRQWFIAHSPYGPYLLLTTLVVVITILAASGVITSGSRGARLGLMAAVAVMTLAALPWPGRVVGLVVLAGLAAFAFNLIPNSLYAQATSFLGEYGTLDARGIYLTNVNFSNVERLAHWQAGLDMIRNHPWLGVGFGNYDAVYDQYRLLYWINALGHAHNYYINVFAETGVFGFLAYVVLWLSIFAGTWRAARHVAPASPSADTTLIGQINHALHSRFVAVGLLGTWAHLAVHHLVDNLYVANTFLLIGILLGLIRSQPQIAPDQDAPLSSRYDED